MKSKLLILLICLFAFIFPILAEDTIKYKETLPYQNVLDIISYDKGYYILYDNQKIIKYNDDNKEIANKIIDSISIQNITKINNHILLIGEKDNFLNILIFDENLRLENKYETEIMLNSSNTKYYQYDSKIYIILSIDGIISNNKVIIINETLDYSIKRISEITNLKEIIKSDYYYYDNNEKDITYTSSTYILNNNYLIGYKEENEKIIGTLKSIEANQYIYNNDYKNIDIKTFNNYLAVLSTNDLNSKLQIYDQNGNFIDEKIINEKAHKLSRLNNNLAIICNGSIILYNYPITIEKDKNIFGNIDIIGEIKPFNEITVDIKPNSGYEINGINLQTFSGQKITLHNNKFIMPEDSVKINVEYKETVINPETIDPIFIIISFSIVLIIIVKKLYSKYRWLK